VVMGGSVWGVLYKLSAIDYASHASASVPWLGPLLVHSTSLLFYSLLPAGLFDRGL